MLLSVTPWTHLYELGDRDKPAYSCLGLEMCMNLIPSRLAYAIHADQVPLTSSQPLGIV